MMCRIQQAYEHLQSTPPGARNEKWIESTRTTAQGHARTDGFDSIDQMTEAHREAVDAYSKPGRTQLCALPALDPPLTGPVFDHVIKLLDQEKVALPSQTPGDSLFMPAGKLIMTHYRRDYLRNGYAFKSSVHDAPLHAADGTQVRRCDTLGEQADLRCSTTALPRVSTGLD